jgi:protein Tex
VAATVRLLDEGATVPFIARYRKEVTGSLDDGQLRLLEERLGYLRELDARRTAVLASIEEQGKLTDDLRAALLAADTKSRVEDIYLPFKPKRRTKAQIAREAGLEPLADRLLSDPTLVPEDAAAEFLGDDVADAAAALDGARHILIERAAEDAELVGAVRAKFWADGSLRTSPWSEEIAKSAAAQKFRDYFDFSEPLEKMPSHRVLAVMRGEKEQVLALQLEGGDEEVYHAMVAKTLGVDLSAGAPATPWLATTVRLAWRVKLMVSAAVDARIRLKHRAEEDAVAVFAKNLKDLLLAAPAGTRTTLGLDPGFRTGVKVAVVDATGKVVDTCAIFPHQPQQKWNEAKATLGALIARHGVELIAIGNGTASRETDALATELIADIQKSGAKAPIKAMVSEAGASVYSASAYAAHELPTLDVTLRGAVSIARRLQDPLAELVKIEPKSIGVGQYQHDITPGTLARSLDAVVEDAVNAVGVDLNTASVPLLARVSGVTDSLAEAIVAHRESTGPFRNRKALLTVPRLGPKAFEQCAGFLRIRDGEDPLDGSGVHPESYPGPLGRDPGRTDRRREGAAPAGACRLRRRPVRHPDGHRHPRRTGEAGPRPAAGILDRDVRRRRGEGRRSRGGHGARGRGDQRRRVRCVRRRRRPSGRPGARLGDVGPLRLRPARGGPLRTGGQGEGPRGRRGPAAHRADAAAQRHPAAAQCGQARRAGAKEPDGAAKGQPRQGHPTARGGPGGRVDGAGAAGRRLRPLTPALGRHHSESCRVSSSPNFTGTGRFRTRTGHQNHRPRIAAMDGVMNDRTISVSNSRPRAIVVPI